MAASIEKAQDDWHIASDFERAAILADPFFKDVKELAIVTRSLLNHEDEVREKVGYKFADLYEFDSHKDYIKKMIIIGSFTIEEQTIIEDGNKLLGKSDKLLTEEQLLLKKARQDLLRQVTKIMAKWRMWTYPAEVAAENSLSAKKKASLSSPPVTPFTSPAKEPVIVSPEAIIPPAEETKETASVETTPLPVRSSARLAGVVSKLAKDCGEDLEDFEEEEEEDFGGEGANEEQDERKFKGGMYPNGNNRQKQGVQQDLFITSPADTRAVMLTLITWSIVNFDTTIYDPCCGTMSMVDELRSMGFKDVIYDDLYTIPEKPVDFLTSTIPECGFMIINPPYCLKFQFLERAFDSGIPFAMLLPTQILSTNSTSRLMNDRNDVAMLIPVPRPTFTKPDGSKLSLECVWILGNITSPVEGAGNYVVRHIFTRDAAELASEADDF